MAYQPPQHGQAPGNPQPQFYQQPPQFQPNGFPQQAGIPKPAAGAFHGSNIPPAPNGNGNYQNGSGNLNGFAPPSGPQQQFPPAFSAQQIPNVSNAQYSNANISNYRPPSVAQPEAPHHQGPPQLNSMQKQQASAQPGPNMASPPTILNNPNTAQGPPPHPSSNTGQPDISQNNAGVPGAMPPNQGGQKSFPPGSQMPPQAANGPFPPGIQGAHPSAPNNQGPPQNIPGAQPPQPSQNGSRPFPPGPGGPASFPPGQVAPGMNPPTSGGQGSFPQVPNGQGSFQPGQSGPGSFPPGPSGPGAFPPGPGAPGAYPPGPGAPGAFPQGPGGQGAFPPGPGGPGAFPPGPGAPGAFPPGPGAPGAFPPGPGGPGAFPPGPGAPGAFPPGPGGPGAFPPGPGGPGMPGGYPGPPQQRQQRLDPNMMPSAVTVIDEDMTRAGLFPTGFPHAELPPLVSTSIYAQDQGNCNPKFMRSTIYTAPQTNDLLKTSQIPFSVVVSPFAALNELEREPPVVDLGPSGPVRCQRCKAYICPFMEFQDGGRRFRCPFCHASTPVEDAYFAHLDHTGRRTDIEMRPELFLGAYDLVATKQYCKNGIPPKEPAYIFLIDVSYNSISNGLFPLLCQNLEKVLQNLPRESGQLDSSIHIGLAAYDQSVYFFDLSTTFPQVLVVSDLQEPFVPYVDKLLLPYNEAIKGLRETLSQIPQMFGPNKATETMLYPAVQAGLDALKCADRAGKLIVFSTVLPTFDAPGKLKTKNERNLLGTDKEKTALIPQEESYTKLGEQCVKSGVTVDLFLFPNSFIDVATIGQLSAVTGGSIFKFQYFSAEKDGIRMLKELERHISKKVAFDCMARVRTSSGIRPITFMGSFYMENSTDLELASIDEGKAFIAEIKHDDKLSDQNAVIQTAILYTSMTGQRRLRILNLCLPVSSDYNQLFRLAHPESLTTHLIKQAVQLNREKGNKEMRDQLTQRCAHILASYREKCSEASPLGQLILPEALKLLPLFVNSILKNDAVSGGSEMTVDDKVWQMELIRGIRVEDAIPLIYPRVLTVSDLELPETGELKELPKQVRASMEFFENTKAYIIDNGVVVFLWIGLGVAQQWVQDIFGVGAVTMIDTENGIIPEKDNARSRALRKVIELLPRGIRHRKTFVVVEKSSLEPWMKKFLVEDKSSPTNMSYVDFLCYVHREIRNLVT